MKEGHLCSAGNTSSYGEGGAGSWPRPPEPSCLAQLAADPPSGLRVRDVASVAHLKHSQKTLTVRTTL